MKNKRSFIKDLSKKQVMEIKGCTDCRECLKHCPVQMVTGNADISTPEKIKIYKEFIDSTDSLKARIFGKKDIDEKLLKDFAEAVFECTTCGACGEICPVGLDTQRLWPALRREMVKRGIGPFGAQREMQKAISDTGNPYNEPAEERFKTWFPDEIKIAEQSEIAYYAGCTGAYEAHPMVRSDVLVLDAIGEPFTMLSADKEVCCGFPLFITGQHEMLEELTNKLVSAYAEKGVRELVCSCPCCVNIMSRDWPIFYGSELPFRIVHISQYVKKALEEGRLKLSKGLKEKIIYHDPCYLSRGVGVIEEPREVLRHIDGAELIEFDAHGRNSRCCGAGGAARKIFHENAIAMGRLTIDEAVEKGADRLVLSCPACYAKVNEAMKGHKKQITIVDIMELISECI
ncbi:MAG: (Fe-S)-binding protein [Nitrospirota bacterium]|nr:MAG: (Fe-S)-binding protein [Nitrospirota bacterium]